MEGPPAPPEKKEKEQITDAQCIEAMKQDNWNLAREWQDQEFEKTNKTPTQQERTTLTIRFARMKLAAGYPGRAFETLDEAHWDAMCQDDFDTARQLEEVMNEVKKQALIP